MKTADLKSLLERVHTWPEAAQEELAAVASEIESELQGQDYVASREELEVIDAAMAAIDRGEIATETEVASAFCKISSRMKVVYSRRAVAVSTGSPAIMRRRQARRSPVLSNAGFSM